MLSNLRCLIYAIKDINGNLVTRIQNNEHDHMDLCIQTTPDNVEMFCGRGRHLSEWATKRGLDWRIRTIDFSIDLRFDK
jgi:hypothetical protein